jgi:hypothetical protein
MPTDKFEVLVKSIRVPIWLAGNKTWYVRTDGNDNNDGSADDAAHAFRTPQKAVNYVAENYNLGIYTATISIGPGAFSPFILPKYSASTGRIKIVGDGINSSTITGTDETLITGVSAAGRYDISGMSLFAHTVSSTALTWAIALNAPVGVEINISNMSMYGDETENSLGYNQILVASGTVNLGADVTITAQGRATESRLSCIQIPGGKINHVGGGTITTINGTGNVCCVASSGGVYTRNIASPYPVFAGDFTGKRYQVDALSQINTRGGGANFFSGTIAGTVDSAGFGVYK